MDNADDNDINDHPDLVRLGSAMSDFRPLMWDNGVIDCLKNIEMGGGKLALIGDGGPLRSSRELLAAYVRGSSRLHNRLDTGCVSNLYFPEIHYNLGVFDQHDVVRLANQLRGQGEGANVGANVELVADRPQFFAGSLNVEVREMTCLVQSNKFMNGLAAESVRNVHETPCKDFLQKATQLIQSLTGNYREIQEAINGQQELNAQKGDRNGEGRGFDGGNGQDIYIG